MKRDYFSKIAKFYYKHKRMPSFSEIMAATGFQSKNAVHKLVKKLVAHGLVRQDTDGKLLPSAALQDIKLLGFVQAGFPTPAEEELGDTMNLDEYLIQNRESTYILKVSGDSMKDAGIMAGDMVLVERGATPKSGDIVIAEIDGEWTVKYFRKSGGKIFLQPANSAYQTLYPKVSLKIGAVVKAVIRKY